MVTPDRNSDDCHKAADTPDEPATEPGGVSALIARILNQLSLTAWLPAAFFVFSIAILFQFRESDSPDLGGAVTMLVHDPWPVLVATIPLVVIATMLTQAFSFEAIRVLEGYWTSRGPVGLVNRLLSQRFTRRRLKLIQRLTELQHVAQLAALKTLWTANPSPFPRPVVWALDSKIRGGEEPPLLSDTDKELIARFNWEKYMPEWALSRIDDLTSKINRIPKKRALPTTLGNTLRSTELRLHTVDGDIEGFVIRHRHLVPKSVREHHDQYRNRLDMYCILVFVSLALTALTPALLISSDIPLWGTTLIAMGFLLLALVSYGAAVASARGYCSMLMEMNAAI